jgi:excisionase family DNA binding protein
MAKSNNPLLAGYVDRDELAKIFNVSPRTICRWASRADSLPHIKLGARTLFNLESVRTWLAKRERSISRRRAA